MWVDDLAICMLAVALILTALLAQFAPTLAGYSFGASAAMSVYLLFVGLPAILSEKRRRR